MARRVRSASLRVRGKFLEGGDGRIVEGSFGICNPEEGVTDADDAGADDFAVAVDAGGAVDDGCVEDGGKTLTFLLDVGAVATWSGPMRGGWWWSFDGDTFG